MGAVPFWQLIYTSRQSVSFTKEMLKELLVKARYCNHKKALSGILVYDDGFFFQVLEGEKDAVESTFEKIKKDPRHKNVRILFQGKVLQKSFNEWSMGFMDTSDSSRNTEGFIPIGDLEYIMSDDTLAKRQIKQFQKGNWRFNADME